MRACPDCGERLIRLGDRLFQCPISGMYYISTYGVLSMPLLSPPPQMVKKAEEEKKPPSPLPLVRTIGVPRNLEKELTDNIGSDNIPLFMRFLTEVVKLRPVQFLFQPKDVREIVEMQSFPKWLESKGIIPAQELPQIRQEAKTESPATSS